MIVTGEWAEWVAALRGLQDNPVREYVARTGQGRRRGGLGRIAPVALKLRRQTLREWMSGVVLALAVIDFMLLVMVNSPDACPRATSLVMTITGWVTWPISEPPIRLLPAACLVAWSLWLIAGLYRLALVSAGFLARPARGMRLPLLREDLAVTALSDHEVAAGFVSDIVGPLIVRLAVGAALCWVLQALGQWPWQRGLGLFSWYPSYSVAACRLDPLPWLMLLASSVLAVSILSLGLIALGRAASQAWAPWIAGGVVLMQLAYPYIAVVSWRFTWCGFELGDFSGAAKITAALLLLLAPLWTACLALLGQWGQARSRIRLAACILLICVLASALLGFAAAYLSPYTTAGTWLVRRGTAFPLAWAIGLQVPVNPLALPSLYYAAKLEMLSPVAWPDGQINPAEALRYPVFLVSQVLLMLLLARAARMAVARRRQEW